MRAKIAVVGGGLMGTQIAWQLAQRTDGLRETVVLCEKDQVGSGASGRAGAVLSQVHSNLGLAGMARDSLKLYAGFEGRSGRSIGYQACGVLTLAADQSPVERKRLTVLAEELVSIGIQVQLLDEDALRELMPDLHVEPGSLGLYEPHAGFLDPVRTMGSLSALARNQGAVIRTETEVDEILFDGDRVVGLLTSRGEVQAEQVVIAAGPWTASLLTRAGIDLPLRLLRTHQHHVSRPLTCEDGGIGSCSIDEGDLSQTWIRGFDTQQLGRAVDESDLEDRFGENNDGRARHPVIVDPEFGILVRCDPVHEQTRVLELGDRHAEDIADPEIQSGAAPGAFSLWAQQALERRIPSYSGLSAVGHATSWENHTPDGQPIVGEIPGARGLWVVAGFGYGGYELAPSIGEGMAQMLTGKPNSAFNPEQLSPARFHLRRDDSQASRSRNRGTAGAS